VIDAGANLGYATLYFAMHNPVERILAIEANENLAKKLGVTAASARTMGVDVRVALGAVLGRSRKVSFSVRENSRDSSLSELIEGKEVSVEGLRLSEWIERSGFKDGDFRRRNLLKIDVEGAEYEILAEDPQAFSYANYLVGEIHGPSSERDKFVGQLGTSFSPGERIVNSACHTVEVLYAEKLPAEAAVNAEGRAPNSPGNAAHRH